MGGHAGEGSVVGEIWAGGQGGAGAGAVCVHLGKQCLSSATYYM